MPRKNTGARPATIIDVAREAGVSFKTVSRVLNGETNVRAQTRERVMSAAKALDYRINHNARNLRARQSRTICLLYANPSRNYIGEVHLGALQRCQTEGYSLIAEERSTDTNAILALRPDNRLAGVILTPPLSDDPELIKLLREHAVPFVRVAPSKTSEPGRDVAIDDRAAAREMTEHLIGLGHKNIGFICGPVTHEEASVRLQGYKDALEQAGISFDPERVVMGNFTFDSGISAADQLLDLPKRPTAIFASNDDMAAGVIAACYRRRIQIPQELSVAGFDDTPLAATISPSLTTIYQPSRELASEAVGLLLEEIAAPSETPQRRLLDYKLIARDSTAPPLV
ncbi:LacI family DNA-binding transcriptional regulator [Hyphomonas sp.]|uniref:LacI family DNA-binding transcriptional regulator n=1 Tax=Hyphomonas sp. TaxID=87 RepID=UPI0035272692